MADGRPPGPVQRAELVPGQQQAERQLRDAAVRQVRGSQGWCAHLPPCARACFGVHARCGWLAYESDLPNQIAQEAHHHELPIAHLPLMLRSHFSPNVPSSKAPSKREFRISTALLCFYVQLTLDTVPVDRVGRPIAPSGEPGAFDARHMHPL